MRWPGRMAVVVLALAVVSAVARAQALDPAPAPTGEPASAAPSPPGPRPLPELPHGGRVVIAKVEGMIDLGLAPYLVRVIGELGAKDLLVLDINTHGGRVDAAVVIRDALLHARARTVCWVNPRAISAGALISLACDVIAVADGASIGAATPIQLGQDGSAKPVEEKMVSYMRAEMRTTAEAKGRDGLIAEAMVDADVEVPGLDGKDKLLTLDGAQALAWGIAEIVAADEPALWKALGVAPTTVERPQVSWAEKLARFLSDPTIAGLLMTLGMLGILVELYSGGHGIALVAGLSCLALFFFGHHIARLAGWEEILLFVVGFALLAFEVLVPGHIVPGIIGVLLVVVALVMALVNIESVPFEVAWRQGWITQALASVFGSIFFTAGCMFAVAKLLPRTRLGAPLVLAASLPAGPGLAAKPPVADAGPAVGARGVAATDLRPEGKATLDGRRVEVWLESGFAGVGSEVEVVRVERGRVVVRVRS